MNVGANSFAHGGRMNPALRVGANSFAHGGRMNPALRTALRSASTLHQPLEWKAYGARLGGLAGADATQEHRTRCDVGSEELIKGDADLRCPLHRAGTRRK